MLGKERFYSWLTGEKISNKEYKHVYKVWNTFEMQTMKGCHNLCLKCNAILLADLFEKFKNGTLKIMDYARVIIWVY